VEDVPFDPAPPVSSPAPAGGCARAGCSAQLCVEAEKAASIITTCEFRPEYACYDNATCERQPTGECGWTQTNELQQCLQTSNSPQTEVHYTTRGRGKPNRRNYCAYFYSHLIAVHSTIPVDMSYVRSNTLCMNNTYLLLAITAVIIIGGFWFISNSSAPEETVSEEMEQATYTYSCDSGAGFTMSHSGDLSTIVIVPSDGSPFGQTTLTSVASGAGARFEGDGVVFIGAGEEVQLTAGGVTHVCNPLPSQDEAPFNFGDAGEGGGVKQDVSLIVSENILGSWRSVEDEKFVREFRRDGVVVDFYDSEEVSTGLWVAFERGVNAPEVAFPLKGNTVYIQMTEEGTQADTLNFELVKLTPERLDLIYLDRGGALSFRKIQ